MDTVINQFVSRLHHSYCYIIYRVPDQLFKPSSIGNESRDKNHTEIQAEKEKLRNQEHSVEELCVNGDDDRMTIK